MSACIINNTFVSVILNSGISDFLQSFILRFNASYTKKVIVEALLLLGELWPYIVAGILVTTSIKMFLSKEDMSRIFLKRKNLSIILAALVGVISPLGSYVIIPLSAALFTLGVPLPVLMTLLVSSPLIDPNLFILTAGAFGYEMAVVRLFSSFILGISAGFLTLALMRSNYLKNDFIIKSDFKSNMDFSNVPERNLNYFGIELYKMTKYICRYFLLAILLAAIIKIVTPPRLMTRMFSDNDFLSVLFTTGAGIPFYICGGAAIPIIQQLADLGLSNGAVLAFFISGPITKISNLVLINSAFSTRFFILYLFTGISGAIFFGMMYNFLL